MRVKYYKETDSLYIDLSEKTSCESLEVASGVVVDFDEKNNIVGIDIDNASNILDISSFEVSDFPLERLVFSSGNEHTQIRGVSPWLMTK